MNSFIEELIKDRTEYADFLEKKPALRRIVEDLYPDKAHFIYELLQNSEDAKANKVTFRLFQNKLTCSHNGRPFNEADVSAITDIGESSKKDNDDSIGRFGIGFKAVFVYTESPRVISDKLDFTIERFVVPVFHPTTGNADTTTFEFPFNSKKKTPNEAFQEIKSALEKLSGNALLFLRNIKEVDWYVDNEFEGSITRKEFSNNRIEITHKDRTQSKPRISNWLRYVTFLDSSKNLFSAIAIKLRAKPNQKINDAPNATRLLSDSFVVDGLKRGTVSAFFPAEKETSGLKFHVHAPFITELSRASLKDTPENDKLFESLATTMEATLDGAKEVGLLDRNFLAALPNSSDPLPKKYQIIRDKVQDCLTHKCLIPTTEQLFKRGKKLYMTKSTISNVISTLDFSNLIRKDIASVGWSISSTQKNDRLFKILIDAGVTEWSKKDLIDCFKYYQPKRYPSENKATNEELASYDEWLLSKEAGWLRSFYSLLYVELHDEVTFYASDLRIVPINNHRVVKSPNECYFPLSAEISDDSISCLRSDLLIQESGENKKIDENVRSFFNNTGVKTYGEKESILAILKTHYAHEVVAVSFEAHAQHLKKFFSWYKGNKYASAELKKHSIILNSGFDYVKADSTYIDLPFKKTGMQKAASLSVIRSLNAINNMYLEVGIEVNELLEFFEFLGAIKSLDIVKSPCRYNAKWAYLKTAPGNPTHTGVDRDYTIAGLEELIKAKDISISLLILNAVIQQGNNKMTAVYSNNQSNPARYADSQWVCMLRERKWVPLKDGRFVQPREAKRNELLESFQIILGTDWANTVQFCRNENLSSQENKAKAEAAKKLGLTSQNDVKLIELLTSGALSEAQKQHMLESFEPKEEVPYSALPQQRSTNPEARAKAVVKGAKAAPEKEKETRKRSVSVGKSPVRAQAEAYLRNQYLKDDIIICQICHAELPFKKLDGDYYFEVIEFIPSDSLHYQNHLCLCPNHAAMFKHSNADKMALRDKLSAHLEGGISLCLDGNETEVYFTNNHINDIKAIFDLPVESYNTITIATVEQSHHIDVQDEYVEVNNNSAPQIKNIPVTDTMPEDAVDAFHGVVIPKHLVLWKNAFITTTLNSDQVSIGSKKEVLATFDSITKAENWWAQYQEFKEIKGSLTVRTEAEAREDKAIKAKKPQMAKKSDKTVLTQNRPTKIPSPVRKIPDIKRVKIPDGKSYCPKCNGVISMIPCRSCFGTGWV